MTDPDLTAVVEAYLEYFPNDRARLALLQRQLAIGETMDDRKNFTGHITGGAIVLSPDHSKVLMVHHRFLDRWLQPGGHWEPGEPDPHATARREAEEETDVKITAYLPLDAENPLVPVYIDSHYIPANDAKNEAEHYHHDFRYVFEATDEALEHDAAETNGAAWFALDSPEVAAADLAPVMQRIRKHISKH